MSNNTNFTYIPNIIIIKFNIDDLQVFKYDFNFINNNEYYQKILYHIILYQI